MDLLLRRIARKNLYTIGRLYIDGEYFCDTIEDKDRGLSNTMSETEILKIKVPSETAIPSGTYRITMDVVSPRFKNRSWARPYGGKIPRLLEVPGFDGVLVHPGTDQNSTSGCIIVGKNKVVGKVTDSQLTFKSLMEKLSKQKDITITIR